MLGPSLRMRKKIEHPPPPWAFATICFAFNPREPKDTGLLSDMSQRYNSNVDFSETQIIIWVE